MTTGKQNEAKEDLERVKNDIISNRIAPLTRDMRSCRKMMESINEVDENDIELEFIKRFMLHHDAENYTK